LSEGVEFDFKFGSAFFIVFLDPTRIDLTKIAMKISRGKNYAVEILKRSYTSRPDRGCHVGLNLNTGCAELLWNVLICLPNFFKKNHL
jgi:hypothetical protein